MDPRLTEESEKLARSWMRHEPAWLRDYLVAGVEDPRVNLQSILTRHFLARALFGERFEALMREEVRWAAVMNWLLQFAREAIDPEETAAVLDALRRGSDNAEGRPIPPYVGGEFRRLEEQGGAPENYVARFLAGLEATPGPQGIDQRMLGTFERLWHAATDAPPGDRLSVYEAACGSANDYRYLDSYGLARWLDYTGGDLCRRNVENAREMFPGVRFEEHNVFNLPLPDKACDVCFFHDLLEHLSPAGLEAAVRELSRITRSGICAGFFNMDEIPDHIIQPVEDYHWNRLSAARTLELFQANGFSGRLIHIGTWLQHEVGCDQTHNPFAYTMELRAR